MLIGRARDFPRLNAQVVAFLTYPGKHMLKFYFHPSPNPMKVALLLEELQCPFEVIAVDTFKGEQHKPEFLKINPNGKVPAIVDDGVTRL
jgi:glutathione S-transferase